MAKSLCSRGGEQLKTAGSPAQPISEIGLFQKLVNENARLPSIAPFNETHYKIISAATNYRIPS
jgi:hypothetical protein